MHLNSGKKKKSYSCNQCVNRIAVIDHHHPTCVSIFILCYLSMFSRHHSECIQADTSSGIHPGNSHTCAHIRDPTPDTDPHLHQRCKINISIRVFSSATSSYSTIIMVIISLNKKSPLINSKIRMCSLWISVSARVRTSVICDIDTSLQLIVVQFVIYTRRLAYIWIFFLGWRSRCNFKIFYAGNWSFLEGKNHIKHNYYYLKQSSLNISIAIFNILKNDKFCGWKKITAATIVWKKLR